MAYSGTAPLVRDLIIENLRAAIQAIAPPTYGSDLTGRVVKVWDGDPFTLPSYPAVMLTPIGESLNDQRLRLLSHEMQVVAICCVSGTNWASLIERLLADVRVAVLADHTRGGYALTTRVEEVTYWDSTESAPKAAAQLMIRVLYRTLYDDPTTAA